MGRFDDQAYLDAYRDNGTFPAIHRDMSRLVAAFGKKPGPVLDLGASTGLLTAQLRKIGFEVVAVEGSLDAVTRGIAADTFGDVLLMHLGPATQAEFGSWLRGHRIRIVAARRVIPELQDSGIDIAEMGVFLRDAGVRQLFIEGRRESSRSVHPLRNVEAEIAALGWHLEERIGECAYLVP